MGKSELNEVIYLLPYTLKNEIGGYATSIELASTEIFLNAGIEKKQEILDKLIFLACIKRIWTIVSSQFWIVDNTLTLISHDSDFKEVKVGATIFSKTSDTYKQLKDLRDKFELLIHELELNEIVQSKTLVDILKLIDRESRSAHER